MSNWTYVRGQVIVSPIGRTQLEKEYILKTVLNHLPFVTGSEKDMDVYVNQIAHHDFSSSHDEFGMRTDKAISYYGYHDRHGMFRTSSYYILSLHGNLRDRTYEETVKDVVRWISRLSKRCMVSSILVSVTGYSYKTWKGERWLCTNATPFKRMFENPSWVGKGTANWCEYLMWERAKDSDIPLAHSYKYGLDDEDSEEFLRRKRYESGDGD